MPDESVRTVCDEVMAELGLEPDDGRKERIHHHCPRLQRTAQDKCDKRCSPDGVGHIEASGQMTYRVCGDR